VAEQLLPDVVDDVGRGQVGERLVGGDVQVVLELEAVGGEAGEAGLEEGVDVEEVLAVGELAAEVAGVGEEVAVAAGVEAAARGHAPDADAVLALGEAGDAEGGVELVLGAALGGAVDGGLELAGDRPEVVELGVGAVGDGLLAVVTLEAAAAPAEVGGLEDLAEVGAGVDLELLGGDVGALERAGHAGEHVGAVERAQVVEVEGALEDVGHRELLAEGGAVGVVVADEGGELAVGRRWGRW
jgi:hypothetical protein